ncbi:MAG: crossover junction endodeoxyribonuclease RuvC [bacterium]
MVILGIDPGLCNIGYGLINSENNYIKIITSGNFTINSKLSFPERLKSIYDNIQDLLNDYNPDVMAIENVFVNKNAKVSLKLGHARGVIILAVINRGIPITEYTPREIKQSIVGIGRASKTQIQAMILQILNLKNRKLQEDEADGLAVAICHEFKRNKFGV